MFIILTQESPANIELNVIMYKYLNLTNILTLIFYSFSYHMVFVVMIVSVFVGFVYSVLCLNHIKLFFKGK